MDAPSPAGPHIACGGCATWSEEAMTNNDYLCTLHESIQAEAREAAAKAMITNDYEWLIVLMIKPQFAQKGGRAAERGNVAVTWHDFKQLHINIAVHCRQAADEMGAPHRQHDRLIEDMQKLLAHDSDLPAVGVTPQNHGHFCFFFAHIIRNGRFPDGTSKPDSLCGPPVHDITHPAKMMTGLPQMKRKRANPHPNSWAAHVAETESSDGE